MPRANDRPRRVALFTNHLTIGGAEAQLVRLAARLVANGDEVRLISLLPTEAYAEEMAALGVPIVELRGGRVRSAAYIVQARRVLRQFRPDVVISFLYQANVVARVASRLARRPIVISSIRNEFFGGRGRDMVMRFTDRLATRTTTNSALAAASLVGRRVTPQERLVVVPNGVDVDAFDRARLGESDRRATRSGFGVTDDDFLWLAAGRLVEQKDFATLVDAFAQLRLSRPHARLFIAGDGDLEAELLGQIAHCGLQGIVSLLGVRSDLPQLMSVADGFVLSSRWEGMPNVVMEAMAARLPVVSTRVGGAPELVDDPATGLLVAPGDARALADALDETMGLSAQERVERGARGRTKIERNWSLEVAGARWLALVEECAMHRGRTGASR